MNDNIKAHKHDYFGIVGVIGILLGLAFGMPGVIQGLFWALFLAGIFGGIMENVSFQKIRNINTEVVNVSEKMAPASQKAIRRLEWAFTAFENKNLRTLRYILRELEASGNVEKEEAFFVAYRIIEGLIYEVEKGNDCISASEALYGFMGFLTSRKNELRLSATQSPYEVMELMKKFCEINKLSDPRHLYTQHYKLPADGRETSPTDSSPEDDKTA